MGTGLDNSTQLECRIVVTHYSDGSVDMGMYDPHTTRYAPLGHHGPGTQVVDSAIAGLKSAIERAGHRLTFCERSAAAEEEARTRGRSLAGGIDEDTIREVLEMWKQN